MNDAHYLQLALEQAIKGRGHCSPNPAVGAVVVKNNMIIGAGHHQGPGLPHAEINALSTAHDVAGATLYVTLEPCCHTGKTPPCTDSLIQAKIARVVFGLKDPAKHLPDSGEVVLQRAGIICEHVVLPAIDAFYVSYVKSVTKQQPFVTLKLAITIDGKVPTAMSTGPALSAFTHRQRKHSDAILTTVKTIIHDNPQLNARTAEGIFKKNVFVVDARLELPLHSQLFNTANTITVFHDETLQGNLPQVNYVPVPRDEHGLSIKAMLSYMGARGICDVWVEAGGTFFSSMMFQRLADRALVYVAKTTTDLAAQRLAFTGHWTTFENDVMCEVSL